MSKNEGVKSHGCWIKSWWWSTYKRYSPRPLQMCMLAYLGKAQFWKHLKTFLETIFFLPLTICNKITKVLIAIIQHQWSTFALIRSNHTICGFSGSEKGIYFDAKQIQKAIGLLKTNGVKIDGQDSTKSSGVGLYPTYSLTNHSCIGCNTRTHRIFRPNNVSYCQNCRL